MKNFSNASFLFRTLARILFLVLLIQCSSNDEASKPVSVHFEFSHVWNGTEVTEADFNEIKFTTEHGEALSMERLRYLISDITFVHQDGTEMVLEDYFLIDLSQSNSLSFRLSQTIPSGTYTSVSFRFGFSDAKNVDGAYPDLNTASWNVPAMLGGGYHYLQFDGKYLDIQGNQAPFNYHAIRAVDRSNPDNLILQDTSFAVALGSVQISEEITFRVQADVSEWFKNPYLWDLNVWDTVLMPNFEAQLRMHENGASVFSLDSLN